MNPEPPADTLCPTDPATDSTRPAVGATIVVPASRASACSSASSALLTACCARISESVPLLCPDDPRLEPPEPEPPEPEPPEPEPEPQPCPPLVDGDGCRDALGLGELGPGELDFDGLVDDAGVGDADASGDGDGAAGTKPAAVTQGVCVCAVAGCDSAWLRFVFAASNADCAD